jgi:chromosome segregation ATPase
MLPCSQLQQNLLPTCKWIQCQNPCRLHSKYCSDQCGLFYADLRRRYETFQERKQHDYQLQEDYENLQATEQEYQKQRQTMDQLEHSINEQQQQTVVSPQIAHLQQEWLSLNIKLRRLETTRQELRKSIDQRLWIEEQMAHQTISYIQETLHNNDHSS